MAEKRYCAPRGKPFAAGQQHHNAKLPDKDVMRIIEIKENLDDGKSLAQSIGLAFGVGERTVRKWWSGATRNAGMTYD